MIKKILRSYLKFWAKQYLKRVKPKIIAITGSVGKTSTKDAIFEVLKVKFGDKMKKTPGNLNSETGLPLTILGFEKSPKNIAEWLIVFLLAPFRTYSIKTYEIFVLEMAADKPNDIKYLTSIAQPDIAVLTNIGPSHLEKFGSMEKIAEEKANILRSLSSDGIAVLNLDNEFVRKISYGGRWKKITYAIDHEADFTGKNLGTKIDNFEPLTSFILNLDGKTSELSLPMLGSRGNIYAALAAMSVGSIFNLSLEEMQEGLNHLRPAKHRLDLVEGKNGSTIIDDCYNASPASLGAALEVLKELPAKRKIAVLGGMREIGEISDKEHRRLGEYANTVVDEVITIGELAKSYQIKNHFDRKEDAIEYLLKESREGDIILVKASRSIGLEVVVNALKASRK